MNTPYTGGHRYDGRRDVSLALVAAAENGVVKYLFSVLVQAWDVGVRIGVLRQGLGASDHAHFEVRNRLWHSCRGEMAMSYVVTRVLMAPTVSRASGRVLTSLFLQVLLVPSVVF